MKLPLAFASTALILHGSAVFAEELAPEIITIPEVQLNGGLRFQSEGSGTANNVSGYIFAPLSQGENGEVFFVDGFANWNFGGDLDESGLGASSRVGYRWLNDKRDWMFGINTGTDTTPIDGDYHWQAGVGIEAMNEHFEVSANGYIPLSNQSKEVDTGYSGAYLKNNSLYLKNTYEEVTTSFGGLDLEIGTPIASWDEGGFWIYAGYYFLQATVDDGPESSGFTTRAEARISNNFAIGATYSYDDIFASKATGYIRYGSRPLDRNFKGEIDRAQKQLLARRGLPVEREIDVRVAKIKIKKGTQKAMNPAGNDSLVIRCIGTNKDTNNCGYNTLQSAINAGNSDAILVADNKSTNLDGNTLHLPDNAILSNGQNAPTLKTNYGDADLSDIYGGSHSNNPAVVNGTLTVASNTTIAGFEFTNVSITNRSTENITIKDNTFTGSVDGNGAVNFTGINNVVIDGNTFIDPKTSALPNGSKGSLIGRAIAIGNGNNIQIMNNSVSGATGEGIFIENIGTSKDNLIKGNTVSDMRVDVDTNLEAGIFVRNNKSGYIAITNNTVKDNNQVPGIGFPAERGANASDGIEVNICRGGTNLGEDAFTDGVAGSCNNNATFTTEVTNNTVSNLQGAGDGIDFSIGDNGRLNFIVTSNKVTGAGDEAFTLDAFGANTHATGTINYNILQTSGAAGVGTKGKSSTDGIAITLQENVSDTDFTASGVYNFTIKGNTINADTDNLAGTNEKPEKAEGIKFSIGEKVQNGTISLTTNIVDNDITTRAGDGIEFEVNKEASDGVRFDADVTINNNRITQTNDANEAGKSYDDDGDTGEALIKGTFSEDGFGSYTTGSVTITNNTITTGTGAGEGFDYESLSTSTDSSFRFKIVSNNFSAADNKSLKIDVPAGFFGINTPDGTTDFATYLDSINTGTSTEIEGTPKVFRF